MPAANEVAGAMAKLSRESVPVKILRSPFQLAQAKAELERMQEAKGARMENSLLAFFRDFFSQPSTADVPIETQIQVLDMRIADLEKDKIEGVLAPLTEAQVWDVRVEFGAIMATLKKRESQFEGEARTAYKHELDKVGTKIWISKWVELALRQADKVDHAWVPLLAPGEAAGLEPSTLDYLFALYHESFTLTEQELGKSAVPTKKAS